MITATRRETMAMLAASAALGGCALGGRAGDLHFWAMGDEGGKIPQLMPAFEHANPGTRVVIQPLPWSAAHEKLLTAYVGGSLPDVSQVGNTWIAELAAIGALAPVPGAQSGLLADQFTAVLDTNRVAATVYGVPWYVDTRVQFFRRDLFSKLGFAEPPSTWAEWKAALHGIKRIAGPTNYAILLPLNEPEQLLTFGLQQGDPLLRDHDSRGNFASPGFKAALAFYKSLFDEGLSPVATASQISNIWNEFAKGFFSVFISGPWTIGDLKSRLPAAFQSKWATATMPGPAGPGASAPGGASLVVPKTARDPTASWKLIDYLTRPATQIQFQQIAGSLPSRKSAWAAPALRGDSNVRTLARQLDLARPLPKVPEWERIATELQIVAEALVRGHMGVDAAAAEMNQRADKLLAKRRWMLDRGRAL